MEASAEESAPTYAEAPPPPGVGAELASSSIKVVSMKASLQVNPKRIPVGLEIEGTTATRSERALRTFS